MKRYSLAEKVIDKNDIFYLIKWLRRNPRLTKGGLTLQFENKWAKWIGSKYALLCNSGSSANLLMAYAVLLSGKLRNNKVIVPSTGWATTISPFIQLGFKPIMCGTDGNTFGLDIKDLERLLKKHNAAVVVMVQVLGVPNDMEKILKLRRKYKFLLLEDTCAAYGAKYGRKRVGSFGDMSSFSFFFGHQLSTIEGGMVNTNNRELYNFLLLLRSHGWGKDLPPGTRARLMKKYRIDSFHDPFTFFVPAFNLRSTDLNAFIGLRQIKKANKLMAIRTRNHLLYAGHLENVTWQKWNKGAVPCSIHFCAVAKTPVHRKNIVKTLDRNNIETRLFTAGNLGFHPFWKERYEVFHNSVADRLYKCGFFLPNNESLTKKDILYICDKVNSIKP